MSLSAPRSTYNMNAPGFSSLFRMLDDFDKYAQRDLEVFPTGPLGPLREAFSPKFDITEHENHYLLQGELPGVPRENIVIEFTDPQTLVIRGHTESTHTEGDPSLAPQSMRIEGSGKKDKESETNEDSKKKGDNKPKAKYWRSERSFGEFSRVFSFPAGVNQDAVEAKLEHGVLNLVVPKEEKKGGRKIEIKA